MKKSLISLSVLFLFSTSVYSETVVLSCSISEKGGVKINWDKPSQMASMEMVANELMAGDTPEARKRAQELKAINEQSELLPTIELGDNLIIRQEQTKINQSVSRANETITFDIHVVTDTVVDRITLDMFLDVKTFIRGLDSGNDWVPHEPLTSKKKMGTCAIEQIIKRQF